MVFQPKRTYSWGEGFKPNADANVVGAVYERLEEEGGVTKERFLDASRPEESPTHNLFEWDDTKAAEAYRLETSKKIIGCLRMTVVGKSNEEIQVRAFVNISPPSEKAEYECIETVMQDENKREVYLTRVKQELDNYIRRNAHIEELADILIEAGMNLKNK